MVPGPRSLQLFLRPADTRNHGAGGWSELICDRCGRLLNRATGKCVCESYGGNAPAPVATTHPPPEAPRPVSAAAAFAALDLSDRPARPVRTPAPASSPAPPPPPPPPPPRAAGTSLGTIARARVGRRRLDVVAFDNAVVLAAPAKGKKALAARAALSAGQLAGLDPSNRVIDAGTVDEAFVRQDIVSGRSSIHLTSGERLVLSWWGWQNRGVEAEELLAGAFPGRVDQASGGIVLRVAKAAVALAGGAAVVVGLLAGASVLLAEDPPPPAPPAPPSTIAPAEQALRDGLAPACAPWAAFAATVSSGDRPDPAALRPVVDGLRGPLDAATAISADYTVARDEAAYLHDYARRPSDAAARESVSRVHYAIRQVSQACTTVLTNGS